MPTMTLTKIVSGAQTGVDRAALDAALDAGFPCGGRCPRGRRAEDGRIDDRYPVRETRTARYLERTRLNVEESDATLIVTRGPPSGGTAATVRAAARRNRPCLVIDAAACTADAAVAEAAAWIAAHDVRVLNVAGPRASADPDLGAMAYDIVRGLIARLSAPPPS